MRAELKNLFVIVRCRDAGVHAGFLEDYKEREVVLRDSRRIWRWVKCAATLSEVAMRGVSMESRLGCQVPLQVLLEACEIIPCTDVAQKTIQECPLWTPEDE